MTNVKQSNSDNNKGKEPKDLPQGRAIIPKDALVWIIAAQHHPWQYYDSLNFDKIKKQWKNWS